MGFRSIIPDHLAKLQFIYVANKGRGNQNKEKKSSDCSANKSEAKRS